MTSERMQRQIDRLLDEADEAIRKGDWQTARQRAQAALDLDPNNQDAPIIIAGAGRAESRGGQVDSTSAPRSSAPPATQPTSFDNGRYVVKRFLGEGGKKRVYLAHDSQLDRDVAFALIKTEGLDDAGRERVTREAQSMGRLGSHPHIVTVYDIGEEQGQPYLVLPLLPGGDVEGLIEKAPEHRLSLEQALKIALDTCRGLEFAHGKGIIHRDLKPGNVWLTEDGRAMIGDFGLAVAIDRSRLTQAGMMVGTVSYMPPEQAMGGEVGPRSDLYSLGAMLYEMVCGRPPFVGDEGVAIISQHLNTPPVAPTWHRPDCPAGLEALILRLLEKDPQKRPASAKEVGEALGALTLTLSLAGRGDQNAPSPSQGEGRGEDATRLGDDPLYQGTFVGRESELRQLCEAFDASLSGQGTLVMVVGEPGIGKTALCEQLATYVAVRGGRTLVGHCYEEGSLSLPYLAFVEALRTYVLAREPEGLKSDLGSGAPEVARIVSEVRDRVDLEPRQTLGDPEEERWRLLQAVTTFLRNASAVQPLVIVLEDLHWADRGTLDLLLHLARNLQGARLVVVGTYRDVEVDRAHPLSATLAELRRSGNMPRVLLRGLTIEEVNRMVSAIRGQEAPWSRAEAIHRQTEGNPLFVQEVLRYLVEEGLVVREGGRFVRTDGSESPEGGIPEGLRDVIGRRLSRLSAECNQVLAVAAVIGRDFGIETLRRVAALEEEVLVTAIEEALRIAILQDQSRTGVIRYRFAHAFFRQTLYEEMSAPRRLLRHQQVARALESQYATRLEDHASELAEHFAQSTDHADLRKAVHYSELAAQRASAVYAYGEAVRLLEQAVEVQDVIDPDDKAKRCDLLFALAQALGPSGEPKRVVEEVGEEALTLAQALGDRARATKICRLAIMTLHRLGRGLGTDVDLASRWTERADHYAERGTVERVFADVALEILRSNAIHGGRTYPGQFQARLRVLDLVRTLDDPEAYFFVARLLSSLSTTPKYEPDRRLLAEEFVNHSRQGVSSRTLASVLTNCGFLFLHAGDRARAEGVWKEVQALAERSQDAAALLYPLIHQGNLLWLDGRLEEAATLAARLVVRAEEQGSPDLAAFADRFSVPALINLGRADEIGTALYPTSVGWGTAFQVLRLAHLGRNEDAQKLLNDLRKSLPEGAEAIEVTDAVRVFQLEAAVLLEDKDAAEQLIPLFQDNSRLAGIWSISTAIGRHLGAAANLLGRTEEAFAYTRQAIEACEKIRFQPELALSRLQLAELLLEHDPDARAEAIAHLDFAIGEFREMKMQPSLERALRHRGLLKA